MQASASQLRADVAALATADGRLVGTPGHDRARDFLCQRLSVLGLEPYADNGGFILPYQHNGQNFENIVGVIPGADRHARPVLLGAHYDSVIAAPCADDNAAAVAITLAVAEHLRQAPPARDVLVAFFDAEEPPHFLMPSMGSIRFVLDQMDARGVGLAFIQDLTGHAVDLPLPEAVSVALSRLKDLLFMTGAESHPQLAGIVQGDAGRHQPAAGGDAQRARWRHERPSHLPHDGSAVFVLLLRTVGALPPTQRHAREAQLREDGPDCRVAGASDRRLCSVRPAQSRWRC